MKNRILVSGIFALVFSLNLLFSGAVEAKQASPEFLYGQFDTSQQEILSDSGKIRLHDGILQYKAETNPHHLVRKFPAAFGLLFLRLNQHKEENHSLLFAAAHSLSPSKDLPVTFRNLRI